jgi:hypothetical protein
MGFIVVSAELFLTVFDRKTKFNRPACYFILFYILVIMVVVVIVVIVIVVVVVVVVVQYR